LNNRTDPLGAVVPVRPPLYRRTAYGVPFASAFAADLRLRRVLGADHLGRTLAEMGLGQVVHDRLGLDGQRVAARRALARGAPTLLGEVVDDDHVLGDVGHAPAPHPP
jgi:hypothetical protein